MKSRGIKAACAAVAVVALASFALTGSASAKLTGEYTRFEQCPYKNPEVFKCLYSPTESGEVVLGSKKVPIVNKVLLQGATTEPNENTGISKFIEPKNGITLAKVQQPVPGGLAGFVNCKEISNFLLRISCEGIFENGLTGVNSVLELARPASEIVVNEGAIGEEVGVALQMPVKVHLENPLFGSSCYVGSSSSPIIWKLTTGKTSPPGPNKSIQGFSGKLELLEEGGILRLKGAKLVDNAWSAPAASGCGGIFSFIIAPIVNASSGLPAAAGKNTAILNNTIYAGSAFAVNRNDEEHP